MDLQLAGRRVLVTGSSSGIGEAIARMLAQEGAAVIVHGREQAEKIGRVIQISSTVAVQPNNLGSDYSAAKAALNNFTVSLVCC